MCYVSHVPMVRPRDEDNLELPPLDGEETDGDRTEFDEPIAAPKDDGHDPYDDKTTDDASLDDVLPTLEGESVLDDDPADLEIEAPGMVERLAEIVTAADDDASGLDDGGIEFQDEGDTIRGDRGEEGFAEPEEPLDEADLPALDADEEGEAEDGLFFDDEREAPGDDLVFAERAWAVKAKAPLGDVVQVAALGARIDVRLASGAALRSVDGGRSFAASDVPPTSVPAPRGTTLRLPGDRVVSIRSGFDRCLVVCGGTVAAPRPARIVCDLSMELDADAGDVAVRALAYDVGTATLWIGCLWGIIALEVPRDDMMGESKVPVS